MEAESSYGRVVPGGKPIRGGGPRCTLIADGNEYRGIADGIFNLRTCKDNIAILKILQNTYLIDNIHISLNLYAPEHYDEGSCDDTGRRLVIRGV